MTSVAQKLRYTPEEYLALERKAEYKSEYVNGEIYAMGGASLAHTTITLNIGALLLAQLRGRPCRVLTSEMRVKISATGSYVYPDVVVACGDIQFEDAEVDTLLNPTVIIEVLSPTTEAFDRGAKFGHYRQLPSVQEYLLIAQDRVSVERFSRQGDQWLLTEATDLGDTMQLASIGCELPLANVYERVEFEESEGAEGAEEESAGEAG